MVEVLISSDPNEAICIQGNMDELREFHRSVVDFAKSSKTQLQISTRNNRSPHPYDHVLSSILMTKKDGLIRFSVHNETLMVAGANEKLLIFAENLPYDVGPGIEHYHCHFDRIGNETDFDTDSLDTVLVMQSTPTPGAT